MGETTAEGLLRPEKLREHNNVQEIAWKQHSHCLGTLRFAAGHDRRGRESEYVLKGEELLDKKRLLMDNAYKNCVMILEALREKDERCPLRNDNATEKD